MTDSDEMRLTPHGVCARRRRETAGFTLIEMLVVVAVIGVLLGLIVPALSRARAHGKSTVCKSHLRTLGQGLAMYAGENDDMLVPSRMPKLDDENWSVEIEGGLKYRPTFLAMMGSQVGVPPFADPQPTKLTFDEEGEPGDRQNYASEVYLCPAELSWTDERNGAYGYNYQFLGNSRLYDKEKLWSFKNWPVLYPAIPAPARTVAVGDSMGTAAAFPIPLRRSYENNARLPNALGNEGFNLDPPWVDPENGEIAEHSDGSRGAVDLRHLGRANILWLDGHVSAETFESLGYSVNDDGSIGLVGNNRCWSTEPKRRNCVWTTQGCIPEP